MARKLFRKLVDVKTFQECIRVQAALQQAKIPSTYHVHALTPTDLDFMRIMVHNYNVSAAREVIAALTQEAIQ